MEWFDVVTRTAGLTAECKRDYPVNTLDASTCLLVDQFNFDQFQSHDSGETPDDSSLSNFEDHLHVINPFPIDEYRDFMEADHYSNNSMMYDDDYY